MRRVGAGVERPAGTEPERRGEGCLTGPDLGRHRCTLDFVAEVMTDFIMWCLLVQRGKNAAVSGVLITIQRSYVN